MAGLLDFMQSDDARLGIGLLAAAGPSTMGFGQRLAGALGSFDDYKKDQARAKYFDTQSQMGLLGLEKAQRDASVDRQMADAARGFYSPETGFDLKGYGQALFGIDPLKGVALQQSLAKDTPFGKVDPKDYTPDSVRAFASSGGRDFSLLQPRVKAEVGPGGQVYDPYAIKPGQVLADPNKPFMAGPDGPVPNLPFQQFEVRKAGASAPQVNVNTDKSYFGNVAEGLAKNDVALIDAARSAPERIASSQRVKEVLAKNPITGTGAEVRLSLNKALATAGLVDGKNVADTETLASMLASQTLDAIKTSGLGAGQGFTDKDRQFLERAKSGNIEMTGETLRRLADLNEQSARSTIKRGNAVIGKLRMSPQAGAMGQQLEVIPEPAASMPPSVVRQPPAPARGAQPGVRFLGFEE